MNILSMVMVPSPCNLPMMSYSLMTSPGSESLNGVVKRREKNPKMSELHSGQRGQTIEALTLTHIIRTIADRDWWKIGQYGNKA